MCVISLRLTAGVVKQRNAADAQDGRLRRWRASPRPSRFSTRATPTRSPSCRSPGGPSRRRGPEIAWLNEQLAHELRFDLDWLRGEDGLALLTGQIDGTTAQAYAGHQFGSPNPQLGDGRAVLLGDLLDTQGDRRDLHLKGSGRTPFARAGDGKAPLGPMLREAVVGEWLHATGVPDHSKLSPC